MSLGTQEERTEGMKRQAQELIDQAYQRGLKAGVESCIDSLTADSEKYIEQGRNEAWEALKRICCYGKDCLSGSELEEIFGTSSDSDIILHDTASEAIQKIREYEEKKKQEDEEIRVGDEMIYENGWLDGKLIGIVTYIPKTKDYFNILWSDGSTGIEKNKSDFKKTGRHFQEIADVLKKMREEKNGTSC